MEAARRTAYWRSTLRVVAVVLLLWLAISCGAAIALADVLDRFHVLGFPLGFWVGQQGAPLVFVLLVAGYVRAMNALDRRFGVYEE